MRSWYAGSTFEVLADIGKAQISAEDQKSRNKGFFSWIGLANTVYNGVTRKSLMETETVGRRSTHTGEGTSYEQRLVKIQDKFVRRYDVMQNRSWSEEALAELPIVERKTIEQNGWNTAQFLNLVQSMPTHEKLLEDSIAMDRETRVKLEEVCPTLTVSTA